MKEQPKPLTKETKMKLVPMQSPKALREKAAKMKVQADELERDLKTILPCVAAIKETAERGFDDKAVKELVKVLKEAYKKKG